MTSSYQVFEGSCCLSLSGWSVVKLLLWTWWQLLPLKWRYLPIKDWNFIFTTVKTSDLTNQQSCHLLRCCRLYFTGGVPYIWTSGRLCDFKGCENRRDLEPKNIYGWFWSATRQKMAPSNQVPNNFGFNPWSQTGHKKVRQPDNAEFEINGTNESCLAVLNNVYNDGIAWHDVACYHEKPFICEDSDELLNYVASTNRGIRL